MKKQGVCEKSIRRTIGLTVLQFRNRGDITQTDLAGSIGVKRQYISTLERGKRSPELASILRLCKGLGVDPASFLMQWLCNYLGDATRRDAETPDPAADS